MLYSSSFIKPSVLSCSGALRRSEAEPALGTDPLPSTNFSYSASITRWIMIRVSASAGYASSLIGAVSLLFVRHGYEKPRGAFNDSDVLDLKTVVENNAHIGFN